MLPFLISFAFPSSSKPQQLFDDDENSVCVEIKPKLEDKDDDSDCIVIKKELEDDDADEVLETKPVNRDHRFVS
ncbi:helicase swr1-like [Pyrus ussuriensis x Pyrus communis]|uniref:Helicase swr1-like n=1 Tax=Pyrus ussuriensis x Pyrus communis TaxID=2448454 RepID=A0A5N5FMR3_9ROSA|nr:helicase swr1-like [Pyrus ussuriensis x Pyrus communis]